MNVSLPSVRKILAPGEEENLELEEEDDAAAGAGSTEAFPPRAPGMLSHNQAQTEGCSGLSLDACLTKYIFIISVVAEHGFITHPNLHDSEHPQI